MANKLKKKTPPPPDPDKLKPEKEAQVTVKEVVKDERTTKIAGAVCLLAAAFLFIAFTSYLFTWKQDQDKVFQFGIKIFATDDVRVSNLLGVLGAYVSHFFIYNGFGVASYLFCTFFFVLGANLLFAKKIFSVARNLRYMVIGLFVLSVAFAFFFGNSTFSFGGAAGELMEEWLVKWIGNMGTAALLGLAVLSYIIWRFNPSFKLPQRKIVPAYNQMNDQANENEMMPDDTIQSSPYFVRGDSVTNNKDDLTSNNKLKSDGKGIIVIMPKGDEMHTDPMHEFSLTEKYLSNEDELPVKESKNKILRRNEEDMQLEIKETPEEEDI